VLLETIYDRPLALLARDRLFAPLGITAVHWASSPDNRTVAQGNISLRAVDMAKIGQLFLDNGRWQNVQIVPAYWVAASTVARAPVPWPDYDSFGYSWFLHELNAHDDRIAYYAAPGNAWSWPHPPEALFPGRALPGSAKSNPSTPPARARTAASMRCSPMMRPRVQAAHRRRAAPSRSR
jgi:CubicO group peptidase (beta-lactamase class C family)